MATSDLVKKLQLKSNNTILLINPPSWYVTEIGRSLERVTVTDRPEGTFDCVHLFVKNSNELKRLAATSVAAVTPDGLLWISYPKRSSSMATDLTRDAGWQVIDRMGYDGVRQVSIDDDWSAVRFRRREHDSPEAMVEAQYAGAKAHLRPIYDRIVAVAQGFGPDVKAEARKTYVSLSRNRQFAVIKPSTRERVDLGLKLKDVEAQGRLEEAGNLGSGSMTHKVALTSPEQVDDSVVMWLRTAYKQVD